MGVGLPGFHQAGANLRDLPHTVGIWRRRREQALGHLTQRRAERDLRVLRAGVLVRGAGHDPRPWTDLAERQHQGQGARGRAARSGRRDGVRALRARARRRHLQHRHGADARRRARRRGRRLSGVGGEVLHRQRQRGGHGVGVLAPGRRSGRRRLCLVCRRQRSPELPPDRQRRARPDVCEQLPARRLPGARRGHPVHRTRRVLGRAQHRQRRQVQPVQRLDRDVRGRVLRGGHPHANNRILYGNPVTDFPHVRASFVEAYARLIAMKLFSDRAIDYFRSAGRDDRRYLLFNPVTKSKVTSEGETVVTLLRDVLAAKGFEKNTYFCEVAKLIGELPRLEGTLHVNVSQILKFMPNYMFNPADYPEIGTRSDQADDGFFWAQGPARGASKGQFADWNRVYEKSLGIPNVARFHEQATALKELLATAAPDEEQMRDLNFLLVVGHLFSLVVYGQLILEQADLIDLDRDLVEQIFDFQIRDFSAHAVALHGKPSSTPAQQEWALSAVRKPVTDAQRFDRVWEHVKGYDGAYEMRP